MAWHDLVPSVVFFTLVTYLSLCALSASMRALWRLLYTGAVGGGLMIVINAAGGLVGLAIPVNVGTVLIAGSLGVPGVVVMVLIQRYIAI